MTMGPIKEIKHRHERVRLFKENPNVLMLTEWEEHYLDDVGRLLENREEFLKEMEAVLKQAKDGQPVWALGMLEVRINQERGKD